MLGLGIEGLLVWSLRAGQKAEEFSRLRTREDLNGFRPLGPELSRARNFLSRLGDLNHAFTIDPRSEESLDWARQAKIHLGGAKIIRKLGDDGLLNRSLTSIEKEVADGLPNHELQRPFVGRVHQLLMCKNMAEI